MRQNYQLWQVLILLRGVGVEAEFKVIANFLPTGSTLDVRYTLTESTVFWQLARIMLKTSRPLNFSEVNNVISAPLGIAIESDSTGRFRQHH